MDNTGNAVDIKEIHLMVWTEFIWLRVEKTWKCGNESSLFTKGKEPTEQLQLRGYHMLRKDPASACDIQHVKGTSVSTNSILNFCIEIM